MANNTATASVTVGEARPPYVAISRITPGQVIVGRKTTLTVHLKQGSKAAAGFRVRIKGAGINVVTKRSNAKGVIKRVVNMKKKGARRPERRAVEASASASEASSPPPVTG